MVTFVIAMVAVLLPLPPMVAMMTMVLTVTPIVAMAEKAVTAAVEAPTTIFLATAGGNDSDLGSNIYIYICTGETQKHPYA